MLICTAVFPPACWTAGSLPSLWLFNAGPSQAQTSWQREAFPLSVRKHRSSATSSLREARLKHSQKMQEDQPDSRICQKPPEFLLAKKKNSREHRGWEGRRGEERSGGEKWGGCKTVSEALGFIFLFILHRLRKVCISKIEHGVRGWGWKGGPGCLRMAPRIRLQENKGRWRWRRAETAVPVLH